MASIGWKEGFKIAWVNFKELLAMVKESSIALYGAVMTVFAGIFLVLALVVAYLLWNEIKQGKKDSKASDERHIKDLEEKLGYLDSAKISQYKLNAVLETHQPIIKHDTIYITRKR